MNEKINGLRNNGFICQTVSRTDYEENMKCLSRGIQDEGQSQGITG